MVEVKEKQGTFDLSKYQVSTSASKQTLTINETGDTFEVSVKQLTWSKRNKLMSECLTWNSSGDSTGFNAEKYVRECLKEMIVDAPWGKTTEAFLVSIDHRLGGALESLVPAAFDGDMQDVEPLKNA